MLLRCEGCGATLPAANPAPYRCPEADATPEVDHVLVAESAGRFPRGEVHANPFIAYRDLMFPSQLGRLGDLSDDAFVALVEHLDGRVAKVDGGGFRATPFEINETLSAATGCITWAKVETGNVSGSHKARHLMGLAIHLDVVAALGLQTGEAPPLAIASCGNAALAAAVIAKAAERELQVFIPPSADMAVRRRLDALGAEIRVSPRRDGEAGDPCFLRFTDAIEAGALPFCCQGSANGLTLDGGQTLGFEMGTVLAREGVALDHLVIQIGGGALASSTIRAFERMVAQGVLPRMPKIHTVQTTGAAPLARAHAKVKARAAEVGVERALSEAANDRAEHMWPWEDEPVSLAHGILDDETYDWHHDVAGMLRTGGEALVVSEARIQEAYDLSGAAGVPASYTGASGLAGLLELKARGLVGSGEHAAVLLTGVRR